MKVGDVVKRIEVSGSLWPWSFPATIGTVVSVRPGTWPKDWDLSESTSMVEMSLCNRVDILWQDGSMTKDHPSGTLQVVIQDE